MKQESSQLDNYRAMKIILDFDNTIFNTLLMLSEFLKVFQEAGFTEEEFWNNYEKTKEKMGGFDQEIFIDLLGNSSFFDKKKTKEKMDSILSRASNFIYPDFADFAKSFNKRDLMLLSYGVTDFQKRKIEKSKIASMLSEIIITSKSKDKSFKIICQKYQGEKLFFIEDNGKQIDQVKKEFPEVIVLKMERPQCRYIEVKSELADYVIKDFYEAREIIKTVCKV